MITLVLSLAVIGVTFTAGVLLVRVLMGGDPPPPPPPVLRDPREREALFSRLDWRKRTGAPARERFNRPLEIGGTEDGILPPPRAVQGVNDE